LSAATSSSSSASAASADAAGARSLAAAGFRDAARLPGRLVGLGGRVGVVELEEDAEHRGDGGEREEREVADAADAEVVRGEVDGRPDEPLQHEHPACAEQRAEERLE
jgi:hypothetical protein